MKDLIYSAAALILGIILGIFTAVFALIGFGAWVYLDEGKKRAERKYPFRREAEPEEKN